MKKVKEKLSSEQMHEDALMAEAEADIKAGRVYSIEEAHKLLIVGNYSKTSCLDETGVKRFK